MKVKLWLQVVPAGTEAPMGAGGNLYWRILQTDALPEPDDLLNILFHPEDEPDEGPTWTYHHRWMQHDGSWSISLTKMIVDPDEQVQDHLKRPGSYRYARPWWTDQDGDPEPELLRCGWRRYEP